MDKRQSLIDQIELKLRKAKNSRNVLRLFNKLEDQAFKKAVQLLGKLEKNERSKRKKFPKSFYKSSKD